MEKDTYGEPVTATMLAFTMVLGEFSFGDIYSDYESDRRYIIHSHKVNSVKIFMRTLLTEVISLS